MLRCRTDDAGESGHSVEWQFNPDNAFLAMKPDNGHEQRVANERSLIHVLIGESDDIHFRIGVRIGFGLAHYQSSFDSRARIGYAGT
jgi:hypothetical protein